MWRFNCFAGLALTYEPASHPAPLPLLYWLSGAVMAVVVSSPWPVRRTNHDSKCCKGGGLQSYVSYYFIAASERDLLRQRKGRGWGGGGHGAG